MTTDLDVLVVIEAAWEAARALEPAADRVTAADLARVRVAVDAMVAARARGAADLSEPERQEAKVGAVAAHARAATVALAAGDRPTCVAWLQAALGDCTDPDQVPLLRAALDDPEPYRALVQIRYLMGRGDVATARLIAQRARRHSPAPIAGAIDRALDGPRPVGRSAPTLWRFNGCGLGFYGRRDRGADDSYTTTHCVSVLWVPLIPLRSYRVIDAERGGYHVLAGVGLSKFARYARFAVPVALALAIVAGLGYRHFRDPSRLARQRFDAAVADARRQPADVAMARLDRELGGPDYGRVDGGRRQRAGAELVRLAAAQVPTPFTVASLERATGVIRRYQGLPGGARGGVATTAILDVLDGWIGALDGAPADQLVLLREASSIAREADEFKRLIAFDRRRDEVRLAVAGQRADAEPVEALGLLVEPPSSPVTMAAASKVMDRLLSTPSLLDDAQVEVDDWLAAAASDDPLRTKVAETLARGAQGRAAAEAEGLTAAALAAMHRERPWDQRVVLALARHDADAGRLDEAAGRLTAIGAPGQMVRDARMLLAQIATAQGRLDDADRLATGLLGSRLARFVSVAAELDQVSRTVREQLATRFDAGDIPAELRSQLEATTDQGRQRDLILRWVADTVNADAQVRALQPTFDALGDVVPASLVLGGIKLRRAATLGGDAREAMLREAERTFLAIQSAAEGTVEYELGLGEIYARLGKTTESEAAFAAVLAKGDPETSLAVASTYRGLGSSERAREVARQVHDSAPAPIGQRAATFLAVMAQSEDEAEAWYRKADPEQPGVRAALLEIEASRLQRAGAFEACAARYADAAKLQLAQASNDDSAGYNNAALAYQRAFGCTGDLARFTEAVGILERAYRSARSNSIVVGNLVFILRQQAALRVLTRRIDVGALRLGGTGAAQLVTLLTAGPEGDRVRGELRADPAWRRSTELVAELEVLAPNLPAVYELVVEQAHVADAPAAAAAALERLRRVTSIDTSDAAAVRARSAGGADDERARAESREVITRLEAAVAGGRLEPRTRAVAKMLLAQSRRTLAILESDGAHLATGRAELAEADRLWPALALQAPQIALLFDEAGLAAPNAERWSKERRLADAIAVLDALLQARDPVGTAIRDRVPWDQVRALALADRSRPGLSDLRLARMLGDDSLAARVSAARADRLARAAFEIGQLLDPADASRAGDLALLDGR